jgi:hypothetical protein
MFDLDYFLYICIVSLVGIPSQASSKSLGSQYFSDLDKRQNMNNTEEIFKDIVGYEGLYQASNLGRIKSLRFGKERILKQTIHDCKYIRCELSKDNTSRKYGVHQLVGMAFLGYIPDGTTRLVVDHKDRNIYNNHLSNLQVITHRENITKDVSGSSKYIGVYWDKNKKKWISQIHYKNISKKLGYFDDELEAHNRYLWALNKINNNDVDFIYEVKQYSSKYKFITFNKQQQKWFAFAKINNKRTYIGFFDTEEEAHEAQKKYIK